MLKGAKMPMTDEEKIAFWQSESRRVDEENDRLRSENAFTAADLLDEVNDHTQTRKEKNQLQEELDAVRMWLCDWDEGADSVSQLAQKVNELLKWRHQRITELEIKIRNLEK